MKKATIAVSLVKKCNDFTNCDIEEEIRKELSEQLSLIPWAKDIESITVE